MSMPDQPTLLQNFGSSLRYHLRGWRGFVAAVVVLAVPALRLGWPWLGAAGLAPLILAMAPCAVMCALGLCMHRPGRTTAASSDGDAAGFVPRFGAGAEPESSADETRASQAPAQSIQTKQKEIIQ